MAKRTDINKILVIGSGPIVIGQAAEFDYAGTHFIHRIRNDRWQYWLSQFFTKLFKPFSVFCPFNTFTAGSQKFHLTLF